MDLNRVRQKLEKSPKIIKRNISDFMDYSGKEIEESAKDIVPERSGQLKDDIKYDADKDSTRIYVPDNSKAGKYAMVVNSRDGDGKNFLRRAYADKQREILKKFKEDTFKGVCE